MHPHPTQMSSTRVWPWHSIAGRKCLAGCGAVDEFLKKEVNQDEDRWENIESKRTTLLQDFEPCSVCWISGFWTSKYRGSAAIHLNLCIGSTNKNSHAKKSQHSGQRRSALLGSSLNELLRKSKQIEWMLLKCTASRKKIYIFSWSLPFRRAVAFDFAQKHQSPTLITYKRSQSNL